MELDEVDEMSMKTTDPGPAAAVEADEALTAARAAIYGLEEDQKEVFLLRVSGELSFEAIAESLGIPVGTAKTRMRHALARLRHHLRSHAPDPSAPIRTEGEAR